MDKIYDENP